MLEALKQQVYEANMELPRRGLVTYTWVNVSGIDREKGLFVIKPSGVEYDELTPEMLVVMDLNGNKIEGELKPAATRKRIWNCTSVLGAGRHRTYPLDSRSGLCPGAARPARLWHDPRRLFLRPCPLHAGADAGEIDEDYEKNTSKVIIETFQNRGIDPVHVPGVLCASHGPFTWGKDAAQAVYHAVVLEEVAKMAILTLTIDPDAQPAPQHVLDKHFMRKHGPNAYYGQK